MAAYTNGHEESFITPKNENTDARVSGSLTSLAPDVQVFI
jgi:hypothetical protein